MGMAMETTTPRAVGAWRRQPVANIKGILTGKLKRKLFMIAGCLLHDQILRQAQANRARMVSRTQ